MKVKVTYKIEKYVDVYVETEDKNIIKAFHQKGDIHSDKEWDDPDTYRKGVEEQAYEKYRIGECIEGDETIVDRSLIVVEENYEESIL